MNPKYKKIYCCTPVAFHANDGFWIRDTGLISNTLRGMGVESKCIMPLPYYDDDQKENLLRTEYKNLKSVKWWKSQGIDALVLYSWGAPKYLPIARAVKKAGIRLVIHLDTSGDFAVHPSKGESKIKTMYRRLKNIVVNFLRAKHLKLASNLTMGTPAADAIAEQPFYDNWVREKLFPMPCPVSPKFRYDGRPKHPIILCIGRWDDQIQKRPKFLMNTLEAFYANGGTAETHIYGTITAELLHWHTQLPAKIAEKIKLLGYLQNALLREVYGNAQIILCPSRFESSHIVSAEALCCGCSVVTTNRPIDLADLHWYTTKNSGIIASEDSPQALANALTKELNLWETNQRSPQIIAETWYPYFHVDKVFNKIFE